MLALLIHCTPVDLLKILKKIIGPSWENNLLDRIDISWQSGELDPYVHGGMYKLPLCVGHVGIAAFFVLDTVFFPLFLSFLSLCSQLVYLLPQFASHHILFFFNKDEHDQSMDRLLSTPLSLALK